MDNKEFQKAFLKTLKNFKQFLPMIFGVIFLLGLMTAAIPKSFYSNLFQKSEAFNLLLGDALGSISAGSPITSYIIGGELLKQGVSLMSVTAFILAWVSVGIIQLPVEAKALGKKFAFKRNFLSFISALIIAVLLSLTLLLI